LGHSIPHILLGLLVSGMHKEHNSAIFRLSRYEQINVNKNKLPLKGRNSGNAQRTKSKAFKLKGYSRSLEGFLPVFNKHSRPECWERQLQIMNFPERLSIGANIIYLALEVKLIDILSLRVSMSVSRCFLV